eukprot:PhM_4_TR8164/c0_g1_i1/m.12159
MRQHLGAVEVQLVLDLDVVPQNGPVFETAPPPNRVVPADDRVGNVGGVPNDAVLEDRRVGDAHAVAHDAVPADRDVRSDDGAAADLRRGVDHDVADDRVGLVRGGVREHVLVPRLDKAGEVQRHAVDEVVRLPDVHPVALELQRVQVAVGGHRGEHLRFDGRALHGDTLEHRGGEDVDARVDLITDELLRLLREALNLSGALVEDDDAVALPIIDLLDQDGALLAVRLVRVQQLAQGEHARHVGVEHEEGLRVLGVEVAGVHGQGQGARRAHRRRLVRVHDRDAELVRPLLHLRLHQLRAVGDGEDDLRDADGLESLDLMHNDRLVAEGHQGLRFCEGERSETCAVTTNENKCLHFVLLRFKKRIDRAILSIELFRPLFLCVFCFFFSVVYLCFPIKYRNCN